MTSTANDLTERLRRRLASKRREIQDLIASKLKRLGENSRRVLRNVLRTIERDTEEATGRMRALLLRAWLRAAGGRPEPLARHLRRELGNDALAVGEHPVQHRDRRCARIPHRAGAPVAGPDRGGNLEDYAPGDRGRAVRGAVDGLAGPCAVGLP